VDPKVIRRILNAAGVRKLPKLRDVLPTPAPEQQPDPELTLDLPGLLADYLLAHGDETVRAALVSGRTIRRGQGHLARLAAPLALHRAALVQDADLAGEAASPAARKAHRVHASRSTTASTEP
jgi:hypothetical protein